MWLMSNAGCLDEELLSTNQDYLDKVELEKQIAPITVREE